MLNTRSIIAAIVTTLLVLAVWKFIDWRMQPPPPPGNPAIETAKPSLSPND